MSIINIKCSIIIFFIVLTGAPCAAMDSGKILLEKYGIQENYIVREGLSNTLVEPVSEIIQQEAVFSYRESDRRVQFKAIISERKIFFVFINETEQGYLPNQGGTYIIRRDRQTGKFDNILVVLRPEVVTPEQPTSYLSITPSGGNSSKMDVYLFGTVFLKGILLPHPVETLVTMPFSLVVDVSKNVVDWDLVFSKGRRPQDRTVEKIIHQIESMRAGVPEKEDGAIDENGRFVFIENGNLQSTPGGLNCSGFAKWLVDGFYYPLTGTYTSIPELKTGHPEKRGTRWTKRFEQTKDTYFGLDWTRNLAVTLEKARWDLSSLDYEAMDVRAIGRYEYLEDKGFAVNDIRMLLYILALKYPGKAYLGTINGYYPANPLYAQYYHVAMFFPFFDTEGQFHIGVFDQHQATSIESIIEMYRDEYIHFVSVDTSMEFRLVLPK